MRIVIILFLAIVGCNSIESSKNPTSNHTVLSDSTENIQPVKTDFTKDSVFTIQFPKDSNQVTVAAKLNGIGKPVTAIIPVKKGKQLIATISTTDSIANVRINQIFTPEGKADGPFGKSVKRTITSHGNYKIIIGEDQMQGDEWKGKFALTIKVE